MRVKTYEWNVLRLSQNAKRITPIIECRHRGRRIPTCCKMAIGDIARARGCLYQRSGRRAGLDAKSL